MIDFSMNQTLNKFLSLNSRKPRFLISLDIFAIARPTFPSGADVVYECAVSKIDKEYFCCLRAMKYPYKQLTLYLLYMLGYIEMHGESNPDLNY